MKLYRLFLFWLIVGMVSANAAAASVQDRHFTSSDGVRLHYIQSGDGELDLIFVPGWLMPAEIFQAQIDAFSSRYRVIAFDPRGQGRSGGKPGQLDAQARARDIQELLQHVQSRSYVLVGWSLGVMEALDFLNRYGSDRLRALVLIDNSIGMGKPPVASVGASRRPTEARAFSEFMHHFVRNMFKSNVSTAMLEKIDQSVSRLPPSSAWNLLSKPYPREYYRDAVLKISTPLWYAITPRFSEQGQDLLHARPAVKVTEFDGAGHAIFVDQAERFNSALTEFLDALQ
jgi:microsomal epoxide hydrolase